VTSKSKIRLIAACSITGMMLCFSATTYAGPFGLPDVGKKVVKQVIESSNGSKNNTVQSVTSSAQPTANGNSNVTSPVLAEIKPAPGDSCTGVTGDEQTYKFLRIRPEATDYTNPDNYEWVTGTTPRNQYDRECWGIVWVQYPSRENHCQYAPFNEGSEMMKALNESMKKQALIDGTAVAEDKDNSKIYKITPPKKGETVFQKDLIKTEFPGNIEYRYRYDTYPKFLPKGGDFATNGTTGFSYDEIANYYLDLPDWQDAFAPFLSFKAYYNNFLSIDLPEMLDSTKERNYYKYKHEDDKYVFNTYTLYQLYNDSPFLKSFENQKTPFRRGIDFVEGDYKKLDPKALPLQKDLWINHMKEINEKDSFLPQGSFVVENINDNTRKSIQRVFTNKDDTLAKGIACFADLQQSFTDQYNSYVTKHEVNAKDVYGVVDALLLTRLSFELYRLLPDENTFSKLINAHKLYNKLHTESLVQLADAYWTKALSLTLDDRYKMMADAIETARNAVLLIPTEEHIRIYDTYVSTYNSELVAIMKKRQAQFKASSTYKEPSKSAVSKLESKAKKEATKDYGKKASVECSKPYYQIEGSPYSVDPADTVLKWNIDCTVCVKDGKITEFDARGNTVVAHTSDAYSCVHVQYGF